MVRLPSGRAYAQPLSFLVRYCGIEEGVAGVEFAAGFLHRAPVDGGSPFLRVVEHANQRLRPAVLRQRLEGREIVRAVDRWDHDTLLTCGDEFSVHHDTRGPPVADGEEMDLGDQEHREYSALERGFQAAAGTEVLVECSGYQVRCHEDCGAGAVVGQLELARALVGTDFHDRGVPCLEQADKRGTVMRRAVHLFGVGDDAPRTEHVMGILGALVGDDAAKHNVGGLLDGELGALDEAREICLKEGERCGRVSTTGGCKAGDRRVVTEHRMQRLEQREPVLGRTGDPCAGRAP